MLNEDYHALGCPLCGCFSRAKVKDQFLLDEKLSIFTKVMAQCRDEMKTKITEI